MNMQIKVGESNLKMSHFIILFLLFFYLLIL